ncbi:MAG: 6-hydroxycyclohex-1-ene-1-carbonyl-CoA dehydrogenase [Myxococcales bacterium]|nr:6-hydroxycyclohex-1-ene-1-carbonyl-CoA dehydrogenase [Myxococcales bacterium]
MTGPGALAAFEERAAAPGPGRVLVKVAGCGVCHTDLSYLYGGVPTRKPPPLALGHEISGVVVEAGEGAQPWLGRRVVVPAVAPCGKCRSCIGGRPTACPDGEMPGNHRDGGFATHVDVPAHSLCAVDPNGAKVSEDAPIGQACLALWETSVMADAVTTPLQAVRRAGISKGELAVVIGAGGVGIHAVQIARASGAQVAAIDVHPDKLSRAKEYGASATFDAKEGAKPIKAALGAFAKEKGAAPDGWRILETSGTKPGQELAWSLLTRGGSVSVVGYTAEPVSLRLSNLMAFDATAFGNWGCDPALYPEALRMISSGEVRLRGLIRREPLSSAPQIIEAVHHRQISERVVLVP